MLKYTIKRLLQSLLTVLIIVTTVFLLMRLMPVEGYFGEEYQKLSEEMRLAKLDQLGLLDPPLVQLVRFYGQLFQGNLGTSTRIQVGVPVTTIMSQKIPLSMGFGIASTIVSIILGIILGVIQATNKGKFADSLGTGYIIFVNSVPPLVYYFFIQIFVSNWFNLPMRFDKMNIMSCLLPLVCMSLGGIASYALWIRRYMVDELNKDYIKLARAKGLPYKTIMYKHVLRNAFVPMAQHLPVSFLLTIGGSLLVEEMFAIPGMGGLLVQAVQKQDNNLVQILILLYSSLGIIGVFLGDILMMIVDPRITLDTKGGSR